MRESKKLFAVVDLETTGGTPYKSKIMEIGIVITDGVNILDRYTTLVNPQRKIDHYVTKLTGISDEMVSKAPTFDKLIPKIKELLDGKIFVAHNVNFDYIALQKELNTYDNYIDNPQLCTVKLTRRYFPGYGSYSLSNITKSLNINLSNAHRALADAEATALLFHKVVQKSEDSSLTSDISSQNYDIVLPFHWDFNKCKTQFNQNMGLIYYYNAQGQVIYIDKSKNTKKTLYDTLSKSDSKTQKLIEEISYFEIIDFVIQIKMELYFLNIVQVKNPKYNKVLRPLRSNFLITIKQDDKGLSFLKIIESKAIKKHNFPYIECSSFKNAEKIKRKISTSKKGSLLNMKYQSLSQKTIDYSIEKINIYNNDILELFKDYCFNVKNALIIFRKNIDETSECIVIRDFYLHSYIVYDISKITSISQIEKLDKFIDFEDNAKLTRVFLKLIGKIPYKLVELDEN